MDRSRTGYRLLVLTLFAAAFVHLQTSAATAADSVRFTIKLDPALSTANEPVSGRLMVFMTRSQFRGEMIEPDFTDPEAVYMAGMEVSNFDTRTPIELDADATAFPRAFSSAPSGEYQIMALLDRDHSYSYTGGSGPGDIYSVITSKKMPSDETTLTLSKIVPARPAPAASANIKIIEFESPMLSAFWGRPVMMQASVLLPPSYASSKLRRYPTVYSIHGYGSDHLSHLDGAPAKLEAMADGKEPEMIYVYLNAHCSMGHHVFADSANNGPWGSALVKEFIPYLEKQYRMDARPSGRFLTGHSSGGWSSLWVMVTHPDFFGGTWSTSPDPVDLRNFTGPDLTRYPPQNAYVNDQGRDYNLVRMLGKDLMSVRQYAESEMVQGYYGGQFASFNAVFSPKGPDGQPMKLFDVQSGRIDPFVQKAWEKYDISRMLRNNWKTLGPHLRGKLHIYVGTADTFHLDEAVRLLDAELKKLGGDAKIQYLEGRTHFDLYRGGLSLQIANEMYAVARPTTKAKTAGK